MVESAGPRFVIDCNCKIEVRLPRVLLPILFNQRDKIGECSPVTFDDFIEQGTQRQMKKNERKKQRRDSENKRWDLEMERRKKEDSIAFLDVGSDQDDNNNDVEYKPPVEYREWSKDDVRTFFEQQLGHVSSFLFEYVPEYKKKEKRNDLLLHNTAKASLRCSLSPNATALICSEFLKDLIEAGHLSKDLSYLACDRKKVERARKAVMKEFEGEKVSIPGLGYDGRKDKDTRAVIMDKNGNCKLGKVTEEHVTLSLEPQGDYLTHFVPGDPEPGVKPAMKQAQEIVRVLQENNSVDRLQVLMADSTATNTGRKGGVHVLVEIIINRRIFRNICQIHTNELPPRHLIR